MGLFSKASGSHAKPTCAEKRAERRDAAAAVKAINLAAKKAVREARRAESRGRHAKKGWFW